MGIADRMRVLGEKVAAKVFWTTTTIANQAPRIRPIHTRRNPLPNIDEFVRIVEEPAYIEPEWGYVVTARNYLIESSMYPNFPVYQPMWRLASLSPFSYAPLRNNRNLKVRRFPTVISLRHLFEWNYYHFYFDVLGKLKLLHDCGIDLSLPIALGRYAMELPWVAQILEQGELAQYNWVIPDREYIFGDQVIYCRTMQNYKPKMDFVLDRLGVAQPSPLANERVFLTRRNAKARTILNIDQIMPILEEYGFKTYDSGEMSIPEQIALFSKTRYLMAIHGAGITNVLFRRDGNMGVIELHAKGYISGDFKQMCTEYHHYYDTLDGTPDQPSLQHANFTLEPSRLREKIEALLAS
jgi:hypothetical protein